MLWHFMTNIFPSSSLLESWVWFWWYFLVNPKLLKRKCLFRWLNTVSSNQDVSNSGATNQQKYKKCFYSRSVTKGWIPLHTGPTVLLMYIQMSFQTCTYFTQVFLLQFLFYRSGTMCMKSTKSNRTEKEVNTIMQH